MENEVLKVLKERRAIRKFKAEQIKDEELNAVLEAGTYAPTGKGTQSPLIVAIQNPKDVEIVNKLNAKIFGREDITPYYGAPTIILVFKTNRAMSDELGIIDACNVTMNMLNAAYSIGLGSCWIHRCKEMFETEEGKALLKEWNLPENLRGVASIALGYADMDLPKAPARREGYIVKI